MDFRIPESFRDPKIFVIAARLKLKDNWVKDELCKVSRDPAFRDFYYNLKSDFELCDLNEFCRDKKIKLFIKKNSVIENFGEGVETYLSYLKKPSIQMSADRFFFFPKGLGKKCQYFHEMLDLSKIEYKSKSSEDCLYKTGLLKIEEFYGISISIWSKFMIGKNNFYEKFRFGSYKYEKSIDIHYCKASHKFYPILDKTKYFVNYFPCKNRFKGCNYVFQFKQMLMKHEKKCSNEQSFTIKQQEYGVNSNLIDKLISLGHLSERPSNENFIFFDIECICPKVNDQFGETKILSTHKLLSIAVNKFINGKHEQKCWVIEDDSKISETKIVQNFLDFCRNAQKEIIISEEIIRCHTMLEKSLTLNRARDLRHDEIWKLKRTLETYFELPIFGFNSSKYDNNVIFNHIVKCLDNHSSEDPDKFKPSSMTILKKGTKYFSIKFDRLHFKDLLNFTCPMSLDTYLATWTDNFEKLVYPFEFFSSILEIRGFFDFPSIDKFTTTVKGSVDPIMYHKCKEIFERHRNLPENDPRHWKSFEDYLRYYNISDVYPASVGMIKQFKKFQENFGRSPMQFLGLPSFASESMFNLYDKSCPNIFSFPKDSPATQIFREQVIGGLVNVFKRHVSLLNEEIPKGARTNKNGKI